jgi:hypothetical protein
MLGVDRLCSNLCSTKLARAKGQYLTIAKMPIDQILDGEGEMKTRVLTYQHNCSFKIVVGLLVWLHASDWEVQIAIRMIAQ